MDKNIIEHTKDILKQFGDKYITNQGSLIKNKVISDLDNFDEDLMTVLFHDEKISYTYVQTIAGVKVFNVNKFIEMFEYKEYWENSYTKYANRIGLTSDDKFISDNSDVVLDFPFKDCILEGGMISEDEDNVNEAFYNETIAKPDLDELLEPKILKNVKKYDKNGEHEVNNFTDEDSLIIKGNNLVVLHSLKKRYAGKIKLIYLDPPYNTGNDGFSYNDRFSHSSWLTFMKSRLEIAKEMLSEDGTIFVQCDDNESDYLGVLLDNIFSRKNKVNTITVKTKLAGVSGSSEGKSLKDSTEYIHVMAKNKEQLSLNKIYTFTLLSKYIENNYSESGKSWKYTSVLIDPGEKEYVGTIKDGSGDDIKIYLRKNYITKSKNQILKEESLSTDDFYLKYADKIFRTTNAQSSIRTRVIKGKKGIEKVRDDDLISIEYVPKTGKNKNTVYEQFYKGDNLVVWLKDVLTFKDNKPYYSEALTTLWDFVQYNNLTKEGSVSFPNAKKPEEILKKIIQLSTNEKDFVLDFFMGSATTQAVAMKMHRKFIGVEQMDYINLVSVPRLQKVIEGEQGGISKVVDWHGGGSFIYAELMEKDIKLINKVLLSKNNAELDSVYELIKKSIDTDYRVKFDEYEKYADEVDFKEKRRLLANTLDKNQLYYNYENIDDADVKKLLSKFEYNFNKSFYDRED